MNIFHYIQIGIVLLGFFANSGNPLKSKKERYTEIKTYAIVTSVIISIIILSAYY